MFASRVEVGSENGANAGRDARTWTWTCYAVCGRTASVARRRAQRSILPPRTSPPPWQSSGRGGGTDHPGSDTISCAGREEAGVIVGEVQPPDRRDHRGAGVRVGR